MKVYVYFFLGFSFLPFSTGVAAAPQDAGAFFSLRSAFADSDYSEKTDSAVGLGMTGGFRSRGYFVEYDYSRVTSFNFFAGPNGGGDFFTLPDSANYDISSHNIFAGYRFGTWAYAELKAGHSYQRIKEAEGEHRVLDEINTQAAGIELGLSAGAAGVALQRLWLGDDHQQVALALRFYF